MRHEICAAIVVLSSACGGPSMGAQDVSIEAGGSAREQNEDSSVLSDVLGRQTTDGALALRNLSEQIEVSEAALAEQPRQLDRVLSTLGLLLSRAQFRGSYADFSRADQLTGGALASQPDDERSWLTRADYLSAVHRFDEALQALAEAERLGAPSQDGRRASVWLATGTEPQRLLALREQNTELGETFETLSALAAVYASRGEFAQADALYVRALEAYRDVSPFPVAFVAFQRGVMWSEMAAQPELGRLLYEEAVRRLPDYVVANVHLAELEYTDGDEEQALARLSRIAPQTQDPEPRARLAAWLEERADPEATSYAEQARQGYEQLLAEFGPAFRDHAAEFYLGAGQDAERALGLAQENLALRRVPRAYALALRAADAAGEDALVCDLRRQAEPLAAQNRNLEELLTELAGQCTGT